MLAPASVELLGERRRVTGLPCERDGDGEALASVLFPEQQLCSLPAGCLPGEQLHSPLHPAGRRELSCPWTWEPRVARLWCDSTALQPCHFQATILPRCGDPGRRRLYSAFSGAQGGGSLPPSPLATLPAWAPRGCSERFPGSWKETGM